MRKTDLDVSRHDHFYSDTKFDEYKLVTQNKFQDKLKRKLLSWIYVQENFFKVSQLELKKMLRKMGKASFINLMTLI